MSKEKIAREKIRCDACPVMCYIAEGKAGAWNADAKSYDSEATEVGHAKGVRNVHKSRWIRIYFSIAGLKKLEESIKLGINHGWFIKISGEERSTMIIKFHSSNSENSAYYPRLSILYLLNE